MCGQTRDRGPAGGGADGTSGVSEILPLPGCEEKERTMVERGEEGRLILGDSQKGMKEEVRVIGLAADRLDGAAGLLA